MSEQYATKVVHGQGIVRDRASWETGTEDDGGRLIISLALDFNQFLGMCQLTVEWDNNENTAVFLLSCDQLYVELL